MSKKFSDVAIEAKACAWKRTWPDPATNSGWSTMHQCVDAQRALLRSVDEDSARVEDDKELTPEGKRRRRAEIDKAALAKLADLSILRTAEAAIAPRASSRR
jgi:hypothetical protein